MVVAGCHIVKWYDSKNLIDLDKIPSLQWNFTNQFGDPVYPNSDVWMSRLDVWLMVHGKKNICFFILKHQFGSSQARQELI